ncbi:copper resistance CopC family protein [Cellulomonas sp. P5_C6]
MLTSRVPHESVVRRGAAVLAGLALALAGTLAGATAAQAHNVLRSTDPADGTAVEVVPEHVTLTFDEPALAVGTEIVVHAPDQRTVSTGPAVLVDNTVTQAVTGALPAGVYTVVYRVTSDDGHPIEGTFSFTASHDTAYGVVTPSPTASPTPTASPVPTSSATATASAADPDPERHVSGGVLIGIAAVLVVGGGIGAWLLLRRRSTS